MRTDEARIGLWSSTPRVMIPYSVSIPITFGMATRPPPVPCLDARIARPAGGRQDLPTNPTLEVLAGLEPLDRAPLGFLALADECAHVDDALALLAGDLGPVIGIGRIGQVLVLPVLLDDGLEEVLRLQTPLARGDQPLDGQLLGPAHDVLHHRPGGEVLEVQQLLVPVGVGDLEELVGLGDAVHLGHGQLDHRPDGGDDVHVGGWKMRRIWRSVSPTYLLSSSGPLTFRK